MDKDFLISSNSNSNSNSSGGITSTPPIASWTPILVQFDLIRHPSPTFREVVIESYSVQDKTDNQFEFAVLLLMVIIVLHL
ncbi:MAG: hypothetical protein LBK70_02930 [Clostridiales bacterium]|nr:hypothetical protein [Clostridiales bacterium]